MRRLKGAAARLAGGVIKPERSIGNKSGCRGDFADAANKSRRYLGAGSGRSELQRGALAAILLVLMPQPSSALCFAENLDYLATLRLTNNWVYATVVIRVLSVVGSLAVLAVGYGYNKDRRSHRDRILAGMFLANLLFSLGNVIPYSLQQDQPVGFRDMISGCRGGPRVCFIKGAPLPPLFIFSDRAYPILIGACDDPMASTGPGVR